MDARNEEPSFSDTLGLDEEAVSRTECSRLDFDSLGYSGVIDRSMDA